jgi:hypothetical protein
VHARRALFFASLAALAGPGCAQSEFGILIEARTLGDIDQIGIVVVDLEGGRGNATSTRPVGRSMEDVNEGEPIRVAVALRGPSRVLVHVTGTSGPRTTPARFVATRCYDVVSLMRDEVYLVGPIMADLDADGDGFPADSGTACRDPGAGLVAVPCDHACTGSDGDDCDDGNPAWHPGARDDCGDMLDQDCDGADSVCADLDGDGWRACAPGDAPGTCDCGDRDPSINPRAEDICRDGVDQDCNESDGDCDRDGDGFPANLDVGGSPDCDDTDPAINPGAMEICTPDGELPVDEDCNGFFDDAPGCTSDDLDGDGWDFCPGIGPGDTCMRTDCDCNDCDGGVRPNTLEICGNGIDDDQMGGDVPCAANDADRDGYGDAMLGGTDCDDTLATVHPGAPDFCGDGVAQNCIADASCAGDGDGDRYVGADDCDDSNAARFPGAMEVCNGIDDDCDGSTNEVLGASSAQFPYGELGCVRGDVSVGASCGGTSFCDVSFRMGVITHCGACRARCNDPAGNDVADACVNGTCACVSSPGMAACAPQQTCCTLAGSGCHDLQIEFDNCGGCDVSCDDRTATHAPSADQCVAGRCVCGAMGRTCDTLTANASCCGGACVNIQDDPLNCGGCGIACGPQSTCRAGRCECDPGWSDCVGGILAPSGCETHTDVDLANCGGCGAAFRCDRAHATETCSGGVCRTMTCDPLWRDCNGVDADGCETSLETLSDCGACGTLCSRANAAATCTGGTCRIGSCNPLFATCDGNDVNGCETALDTLTSCGACGVPCSRANAAPTCGGGTCRISSCTPGFGNCDGNDVNGCENSLDNLTHCGTCGTGCSRTGATATCAGDMCRIMSCVPGNADCDTVDSTGCENTLDSLTNCGGCGISCSRPNAVPTCAGDFCRIMSCLPGFGDCDTMDATGCETPTTTLTNCGTCGTMCSRANATPTCSTGSCAIQSCNAGFGNCDGSDANGCENPLDGLVHCGMCGMSCMRANATPTCSGDVCQISSCNATFDDCDGVDSNGCEASLRSLMHCGVCSSPCSRPNATATCMTGSCQIASCNPNFGNCDGMGVNGCETDTRTDPNHCGGCGIACANGETCVSGSCRCGSTMGTVGGGPACTGLADR